MGIDHEGERTIRRWAARDQWRRTTGRPVRYNLTDADRSWRKRHSSAVEALAARLSATPSA